MSEVYLTTMCGARSRNALMIALNLAHSPDWDRPLAMTDCPRRQDQRGRDRRQWWVEELPGQRQPTLAML
eukprot:7388142-Prymnesium_polylepis.1